MNARLSDNASTILADRVADYQSDFVRAVLDPERATPAGLITPQGEPASKRFNVYRNNIAASLIEALRDTFPLLVRSLGEDFFNAMAGTFLRRHPPDSPVLMFYGEHMPDFLDKFAPVQQYPYLADIARLEIAMVQSYHAADSNPVDLQALQAITPDRLMKSALTLAPHVRLIRSPWPIYQLWRFNTEPDAPQPQFLAEDIVVVRPEFDPVPRCLPAGGGAFVEAVLRGESIDEASSHTSNEEVAPLLASLFSILLESNAIIAIT